MTRLACKVAGVTYGKRQEVIASLTGGEECHIVPEPENTFDGNALAVYVVVKGKQKHIGYLPRALAARLAVHVKGGALKATIKEIAGGHKTAAGNIAVYGVMLMIETPGAAGDLSVL